MAKGKGLEKVYVCSEELAEIINCETTTRPQMTKKIWAYIKKHDLQDPHKKRVIIPDHKLSGPTSGRRSARTSITASSSCAPPPAWTSRW